MIITLRRARKKMKDYIVPACLTVFNFLFVGLITWFIKVKAKSDKADVENIVEVIVDERLKAKMKPVEKDLKEIKQTVQLLQTSHQVSQANFNNLIDVLTELKEDVKTSRKENRENFLLIFGKLETKKDK
jgi:hypothetical protein